MQFNLILEKIKLYKKYFLYFLSIVFIVVTTIFSYNYFTNSAFVVVAGNFDFNYKKIPFDIGYIDFTLSKDLDETTITKDNFIINPKIDGELSLISTNTIRYKLNQKLNIGDDISITLKKSIKSKKGESLNKDYYYIVNVIEQAKVLKITPDGELENLGQNIAVFFNIPMVSLTNLDEGDKLPCPINIEPNIEGSCSWTTSSVLEFIPKTGFIGATKYKVSVGNKEGLLYKMSSGSTVNISTPFLQSYVDTNFRVKDKIKIRFNFPVDLNSLKSKLSLFEGDLSNKKDFNLSYDGDTESSFVLNLKKGAYKYDNDYFVKIESGVKPKYGNVESLNSSVNPTRSYNFLNSSEVFQNIFSGTTLIDTSNFTNSIIPSKNLFFKLLFEDEINFLDKNYFSFEDEKGNKQDFKLSYLKEEDPETKIISENKKILKLSLTKNLQTNTKYKLIVKKVININLDNDIVIDFVTSPSLEMKDFIFVSYSKSCMYLNNWISDVWKKSNDFITTFPSSKINSVSDYEYIDYQDQVKLAIKNNDSNTAIPSNEKYLELGYCPPAKNGEFLYIINTRLNPNSNYKINGINTLSDAYGNNLTTKFSKEVKTGDINESDKYLYTSLTKEINLIPSELPLVVNLQTINLDNIDFELCEMDNNGYIDFSQNRWNNGFTPKCLKNYKKNLVVKNNYWNITNNKFDIEKDIIGGKSNAKILLIKGNAGGRNQFSNIFIRSNLNLTYESAKNKKLLFVTDFSGNTVSDLKLEFINYNIETKKQSIVSKKTNLNKQSGVYELNGEDNFNFVFVYNEKYFGLLDLSNNMLSDYDFNYYGGTPTYDKNYLYLYTERPIYKPGDTVFIKALLRKFDFNGYKKADISTGQLEIIDKNNIVVSTLDIDFDKNSNFNTSFIIPKESPLGEYSFRFFIDNQEYYKNDAHFYIEEYRKPDFKVDLEGLNKNYKLGDKINMTVFPKYYFGGNLVTTKGQYSVLTQNYYFDSKDYSNYQFGEGYAYFDCIYWGYCGYGDYLSDVKDFLVDANGKGIINYNFSSKEDEGEKIHTFNVEVEDRDTKKTVNKSVSTILHNTDGYVGIEVPYWNDHKVGIKSEFVVLDYYAKPLSGKNIKVELIKRNWKEVKKQGVDGVFYSDYSLEELNENSSIQVTNNLGIISKIFTAKSSGEYMIKATYTGANGKNFVSSRIVYVSGDDYVSWNNGNNDTTDIVSEKTQVLIGDTASYTLKSPVNNGKALILIEKDDGILDYFVHDIKSYGDKIDLKVKDSYYPNYYVRAFIIGTEAGNSLPIYKRALTVTKVSTDYKKLNVSILTDKKTYSPGDKVGIGIVVNDSNGKPVAGANGSISIVDESLLALVGNPKKNPYVFFYDMKRYLGTLMYSSMINLIEKLEVKDISNGEKGGAGEQIKGGDSHKKRGTFKDTAFWQADFVTGANGKIYILSDNLPDNLTTWTIEVLVNTPDDNKIGVAYESVSTTKEIIINDNLPNFVGVGDKVILSPVVFNKTGKDGDFDIKLDISNVDVIGGNTRKMFIKDGESKSINFEIKVKERNFFSNMNIASSKVNFKVTQKCDKNCNNLQSDEIEKIIQVKDSAVMESVATIGKTKNASFDEKINLGGLKDKIGEIKINYSPTVLNNIVDSIDYLDNYPYGCSEQKTSSIMPNIYIKNLYSSIGLDFNLKTKFITYYDSNENVYRKKSIDQTIKEYVVDIRKYQKEDGGFVYWYDSNPIYPNYSDFALSSYILKSQSFLLKLGYKQDEKILLNNVSYLKDRFYKNQIEGCEITKYKDCKYFPSDRLNAIGAILSKNPNDYEAYKMFSLLEIKNSDTSSILNKALVIGDLLKIKTLNSEEKATLKKEAKDGIDDVIKNELVFNPRGAYIGKTNSYSRVANSSLLLKAISNLGLDEIDNSAYLIDNLNRWIISQKKNGSFGSTQDNLTVIDAVSDYMSVSGELKNINLDIKLKLNGDNIDGKIFNEKNKLDVITKSLDLKSLKNDNTFNISKTGNGTVYYDLSMNYFLTGKELLARDEGFAVIKEYYDYNQYKKIDSLKKAEWQKYIDGKVSFENLLYKKSVFEYLTKLNTFTIGQLVIVRNKVITSETRDKVAFEGYIPAGAELVNPNLQTSSKSAFSLGSDLFERSEYRLDRFFAYTSTLNSGIYDISYLIRFTHAGEYYVKPTYVSEFYNAEVFGRSSGEILYVK